LGQVLNFFFFRHLHGVHRLRESASNIV
jgi:hypothetical protein